MATLVGKSADFQTIIEDMIELEHDAIAAYRICIERLETPAYKQQVSSFLSEHERHLSELVQHARALNIDVADGPDLKAILTKGKLVIADMFGDAAILKAMKTNEDDTVTAYERAARHENLPVEIRATFEKGLADEQRHRAWMETTAQSHDRKAA